MAKDLLIRPVVHMISGFLRPRGYRKRGLTFWRDIGSVRQLVNLQRGTSSTSVEVHFTLNLAVLCPKTLASWEPEFSVWSAPWSARIGLFDASRNDKWWHAKSEKEATEAAAEIFHLLSSALLVVEDIDSLAKLIEVLRNGEYGVQLSDLVREKYINRLELLK